MLPFIVFIVLEFGQTKRNQVDLSTDNLAEKKLLQNHPKMWFTSYDLDFHSDLHLQSTLHSRSHCEK